MTLSHALSLVETQWHAARIQDGLSPRSNRVAVETYERLVGSRFGAYNQADCLQTGDAVTCSQQDGSDKDYEIANMGIHSDTDDDEVTDNITIISEC